MGFVRVAGIVAGLLMVGCGGDETLLLLDLRTDIRPGLEFATVRVAIAGEGADRSWRVDADTSADYLAGVRILEEEGLAKGTHTISVELIDGSGGIIAERPLRVTIEGQLAATVVITRSCRGVTCPGPGDPESATACFAGGCVPPECSPETPDQCESIECMTHADCSADVSCGTGRCNDGACFERADDALCAGDEVCDLDIGCVDGPGPPIDSGMDTSPPVDSSMDSSPPVDTGADTMVPPADSAADAPPVDAAACMAQATQTCGGGGCTCDSGCSCDLTCSGLFCSATCAGAGTTCDLSGGGISADSTYRCEAGASCTGSLGGFGMASLTCDAADCDITCSATDCSMDCLAGATCLLRCSGISCGIDRCTGARTSCPGRVIACNRACP